MILKTVAIQFALIGDVALVYSSGVHNPYSWGSSTLDVVRSQNRPIDLGINERLSYLNVLDSQYVYGESSNLNFVRIIHLLNLCFIHSIIMCGHHKSCGP